METLVWLDALTPKQLLLAYSISLELRERGVGSIITAREENYVDAISKRLSFTPYTVGEYGKDLKEKLEYDCKRVLGLMAIKEVLNASVLVSYPSPSAIRTAFGLGKKVYVITDTPHAIHAHRLSVPLADYLIYSEFLRGGELEKYVLDSFTKKVTYRGVDEIAWIRRIRPEKGYYKELGLPEEGYIIARPPERYAAYYGDYGGRLDFPLLVKKLAKKRTVVLVPRYAEDIEIYSRIDNVVVLEPVLSLDLYENALMIITGGATMAREASLLGIPSIYTFSTEISVNKALRDLGFPLHHASDIDSVMTIFMKYEREGWPKTDTSNIISGLEDPAEKVADLVVKELSPHRSPSTCS